MRICFARCTSAALVWITVGCGDGNPPSTPSDAGTAVEAGVSDVGSEDSGPMADAGVPEVGPRDAAPDAGPDDVGEADSGSGDAGQPPLGPSTFLFPGATTHINGQTFNLRVAIGAPRPVGRPTTERTSR